MEVNERKKKLGAFYRIGKLVILYSGYSSKSQFNSYTFLIICYCSERAYFAISKWQSRPFSFTSIW